MDKLLILLAIVFCLGCGLTDNGCYTYRIDGEVVSEACNDYCHYDKINFQWAVLNNKDDFNFTFRYIKVDTTEYVEILFNNYIEYDNFNDLIFDITKDDGKSYEGSITFTNNDGSFHELEFDLDNLGTN